jgi:hypothetical protein
MSPWVIFVLLVLKHFLVSSIVDVGYSDARHRMSRRFESALIRHVISEGILTTAVLWTAEWYSLLPALVLEAILHVALCIIERQATLSRILRTHVLCEGALLLLYASFAFHA